MKHSAFLMLAAAALLTTACARHDFLDEVNITGKIGPQAYWELPSSLVNAGSSVAFNLQYYTTAAPIDHSEVWYNITETLDKTVTCPWVSTFTYAITSNTTTEKRILQYIQSFPHSEDLWNDSIHAYYLASSFPVSTTLSSVQWVQPTAFDSARMVSYFGETYMQQFKDSLYGLMKYADFNKMILGLGFRDDFAAYTDSTFDANSNGYIKHFNTPADAEGNHPVPDEVKAIFDSIPFADLVYSSTGAYSIEYKRTYNLNAVMRVYAEDGIYGQTISQNITVN